MSGLPDFSKTVTARSSKVGQLMEGNECITGKNIFFKNLIFLVIVFAFF